MKKLFFLLLITLGALVFAQSASSRGGFLRKPEFQTYGTVALFVDTLGSNSNDCLSVATPCATLTGALTKLPQSTSPNMTNVFNNVTITIAGLTDGGVATYTETPVITGNWGANLTITGPALVNVVPTTGAATGTITTSAHSTTVPSVFTDSAATWTASDFRGRFFCITNGAVSGQCRAIASNTSTTITVAAAFSADPGTATYAIQTPGASISTSVASTPAFTFAVKSDNTGRSHAISNLDFSATSGTACKLAAENASLALTYTRCLTSSTGAAGTFSAGLLSLGPSNSSTVFMSTSSGTGLEVGSNSVTFSAASSGPPSARIALFANRSFFYSSGSIALRFNTYSKLQAANWTAQSNAGGSVPAVDVLAEVEGISGSTGGLQVIRCETAGAGYGLQVSSPTSGASRNPISSGIGLFSLYVDQCSFAALIDGFPNSTWVQTALTCLRSTRCLQVQSGAQLELGTTITSDAGTDIYLDSSSYSFSTLTSSSNLSISNANGSRVYQISNNLPATYIGNSLDLVGSLDAGSVYLNGKLAFSSTAPTISSGFGTSPSITGGSAVAFRVNVGTGGAASTGVVALPTAINGWNCSVADVTTPDSNSTVQTASTTTTASFKNYARTTGLAAAWTASDILAISCIAF